MGMIDLLGIVATFVGILSSLPQVMRVRKTRSTLDLSLWTYVIGISSNLLWFSYGVLIDSYPLIFSSVLVFSMSAFLISCKLRYG